MGTYFFRLFLKRWDFHNSNFWRSEFIFVSRPESPVQNVCRGTIQSPSPPMSRIGRYMQITESLGLTTTSLVPVTFFSITRGRGKGRGTTRWLGYQQTCQPADKLRTALHKSRAMSTDHGSISRYLPGMAHTWRDKRSLLPPRPQAHMSAQTAPEAKDLVISWQDSSCTSAYPLDWKDGCFVSCNKAEKAPVSDDLLAAEPVNRMRFISPAAQHAWEWKLVTWIWTSPLLFL